MFSISCNQLLHLFTSVKMCFNNETRRNICGMVLKDSDKFGRRLFRLRLLKMDRFKIKIKKCTTNEEQNNPRLLMSGPRSVINVEKSMIPNHVLMYNVEDEIIEELRRCGIDDESKKEAPVNEKTAEISSNQKCWSTMTPVEYNQWRRTAVVEEKSKPAALSSGPWPSEDTQLQKGGFLTFFTHLSTLRQIKVPQVGFASSSTQPVDDTVSKEKKNLKVGKDLKLKEGPFAVSGSQKRSEFIASLAPDTFPGDSNTMGFNSTLKQLASPGRSEPRDVTATPTDKAMAKVSIDRTSPRLDADLKECAIITRHRTLTDATTLIGPRTDTPAPHSLLKLRNHPDHSLGDPELQALLKKYKTLKLKEIDYHLAQIKKHRKQLMELMVKKPYQSVDDSVGKRS